MKYVLYFDCCAIIISLIYFITIIVRKNIRGKYNYLMFSIVICILIATIGDIGQGLVSNYAQPSSLNIALIYISNYIYFLAHNLILPIYLFFIYTSLGVWHIFKNSKKMKTLWVILTGLNIILLLINLFTPLIFYVDDNLQYHRGPLLAIFYLVAAICGIWGIGCIVKYRSLLPIQKKLVLSLIYPLTVTTIIIQFFFPYILCEMFGIATSLMIFMNVVQSDETAIDSLVGCKKYSSGIRYLINIITTKHPTTILLVKLVNVHNLQMYLGQDFFNEFLSNLSGAFRNIAATHGFNADLYYLENGLYGFLSEDAQPDECRLVGNDIKSLLLSEQTVSNFSVLANARICILQFPEDFDDFQSLFGFATTFHDTMPSTKNVIMYSSFKNQKEYRLRNDLESIMEQAIRNKEFEIYYQPIYSTSEKRFVSAEALLRLHNEVYGDISPRFLIPMAEATGAIHEIGEYVLSEVCRFISNNNLASLGLNNIEVNLSPSQCIEANLVEKIAEMIEHYDIDPHNIILELTEAAVDIDPTVVNNNIKGLHNLGIRFALDDYGVGYSNIKQVTALPFKQVKLDRSFVSELTNPQMWTIIKETISMLRESGMEVLVEGIETEKAAKQFIDFNCDLLQGCEYIQGFYYCKPLPEKEFLEFIIQHKS